MGREILHFKEPAMERRIPWSIRLIACIPLAVACSVASAQILPKNRPVGEAPRVAEEVPAVTAAPLPALTVTPQPLVTVAAEPAQNLQATHAADLGLWFSGMANNGLTISDLTDNSIFTNAGFRVSDRIVAINGQPIRSEEQFVQSLTSPALGTQPVQFLLVRNGQQHTLTLSPAAITQGVVAHDPLYQHGLVVDDSNPSQIIVQRVYPRTPAYYAGLRQGDVITTFGGQRVTSLNAFTRGLSQANVAVPLQITRSGQTRDIQLGAVGVADNSVRTALRPNIDTTTSAEVPVVSSVPAAPTTVVTPAAPAAPAVVAPAVPATPTVVPPAVPAPATVIAPAVPAPAVPVPAVPTPVTPR